MMLYVMDKAISISDSLPDVTITTERINGLWAVCLYQGKDRNVTLLLDDLQDFCENVERKEAEE